MSSGRPALQRPSQARGPLLTSFHSSSILEPVLRFCRQLSAAVLTLALTAANGAVCAGWLPTPEARMECCSEGDTCPMHKGESDGTGSDRVITQAQADSCCASSERDNISQPSPTLAAAITPPVLGAAVVLPASVPALVLSDGWRTTAPIPTAPAPKHVLLSVFLV